eukprot:6454761-Amphidinium_carterae.1
MHYGLQRAAMEQGLSKGTAPLDRVSLDILDVEMHLICLLSLRVKHEATTVTMYKHLERPG